MQKKPIFHLFIPYLLQSLDAWHQDFLFEAKATYLSSLFTQSTKFHTGQILSIDSAFFKTLNPTIEELPFAYYRYQLQNSELQLSNKNSGLICADPVHLEVSMNDVTLTHKITDLTAEDAKELIEILNQHFVQDGLKFVYGSNQCWYLSFPDDESVRSHDLDAVFLKNIVDKATISDQRNWQVIQNETQMLLHNSDINQHREMAGLKPVNSLWFWGAGKPHDNQYQVAKIYSTNDDSSKLRADLFAKAANSESQVIPDDISEALNNIDKQDGAHILLLDQLFLPALENKLDEFQDALKLIDNHIIKPLLGSWKSNEIEIIIDCCDGNVIKPIRTPSWKFWLKPKNIRELMR